MLHNEVMSPHSNEVNDFVSCLVNGTQVGFRMVKGNDIPVE